MDLANGLEFEVRGAGEAVLLIHGAIVADSFRPLMDEQALSGHRLIRYRRRGYGDSPAPSNTPTIAEHARDARALMHHLGVEVAHIVGHSGGGPIAVQLALDDPQAVRSLTLLEPALQNAEMAAMFDEFIAPLVEMHRAGDSGKAVHLWMRSSGGSDWRTEFERRIPGGPEQAVRDASGTFEDDLAALRTWDFDSVGASELSQPVLYLLSAGNAASMEVVTTMFRAAVPQTEFVIIEDTDHNMQVMTPGPVAAAISRFIRQYPI